MSSIKFLQLWELNDKGNLVSSYSRLCATVESSKEAGNHGIILFVCVGQEKYYMVGTILYAVGITGARAWIATGSKGQ